MSGARCPVQSSEERIAADYKWVGRGEEGCRTDSIKELHSCGKTQARPGELEHIASSQTEWSLLIHCTDAHRLPQPRLPHSQVHIAFYSDRLGEGREAPGICIFFLLIFF